MTNLILIVIAALCWVESDFRADAVNGDALGILQIKPATVAEANRLEGWELWELHHRTSPQASVVLAFGVLASHYRRGVTDPVELGCRWRNPYSECPQWYRDRVVAVMANAAYEKRKEGGR